MSGERVAGLHEIRMSAEGCLASKLRGQESGVTGEWGESISDLEDGAFSHKPQQEALGEGKGQRGGIRAAYRREKRN